MSDTASNAASLRGAVDLSSLVNRPEATATSGDATAAQSGALVREGNDQNFTEYLELSMTVPVIVDLWATWCQPCTQLSPILEKLVTEYAGRLVLVTVDVDKSPQLTQAFQAQSIPTVAAVIGGRPVALFSGAIPEQQVRDVFEQVLQLAAQNGVTGTVDVEEAEPDAEGEEAEPQPEPLPPHHQEAYDAIDRGDLDAAISEYSTAIAQDPKDRLAVAGLAQVSLMKRLQGADPQAVRQAAASAPTDVQAQLLVADLDVSGGHIDDAFDRLLGVFASVAGQERDAVRTRLLDYFEIAGSDDPRVGAARARLSALLY